MNQEQEDFFRISNLNYEWDLYSKLQGIDLEISRGENIIIFGIENSGLNLLFPIISGLHENYHGEIFFKGNTINVHDYYKKNAIRKELIFVHKGFGLINNMTIAENISVPMAYHTSLNEQEMAGKVDELIEELDLVYCRDLRPVNIRDSEALRTAYARAISLDPCLLMVEHPLEGQCLLDQVSFMKSLKKRCDSSDKSVIITTYKPKYLIDFSDRFVMMNNGKIVFDGNAEELLSKQNSYVKQYLENSTEGPINVQ
jgi:ABC-type transporter Mla maintaining outer membrane lipid asymmetry ATPase subunit MlaF